MCQTYDDMVCVIVCVNENSVELVLKWVFCILGGISCSKAALAVYKTTG